jgi:NAD(P)-dependent dehydrogenase (short-subunit alcohol dehydrogenase family)
MPAERIAVVTGASSGIGAASTRQLARAGFHVVAGARRTDRLEVLAEEVGATTLALDVTDPAPPTPTSSTSAPSPASRSIPAAPATPPPSMPSGPSPTPCAWS